MPDVISLKEKLSALEGYWDPRIIAQLNDYHIKIARIKGEFVWHSHPETDELFFVVQGAMTIHLREGALSLQEGELCVIPRGVEHKPAADEACQILMIEPAGTVNTGDAGRERTVDEVEWM